MATYRQQPKKSIMNIADTVTTKLSRAVRALAKPVLLFKNWRAKRNLLSGLNQLQSQQEAETVNVGERVLVLCRWNYGDIPAKPTIRVDIFVTFSVRQTGAGFEAASQYDARVHEFNGIVQDGYGDQKERWLFVLEENFDGPTAQATAKQHISKGEDPIFEKFNADPSFQKTLKKKIPVLVGHYEAIVFNKAANTPTLISVGGGKRL